VKLSNHRRTNIVKHDSTEVRFLDFIPEARRKGEWV
jgi:hypothetical protein